MQQRFKYGTDQRSGNHKNWFVQASSGIHFSKKEYSEDLTPFNEQDFNQTISFTIFDSIPKFSQRRQ